MRYNYLNACRDFIPSRFASVFVLKYRLDVCTVNLKSFTVFNVLPFMSKTYASDCSRVYRFLDRFAIKVSAAVSTVRPHVPALPSNVTTFPRCAVARRINISSRMVARASHLYDKTGRVIALLNKHRAIPEFAYVCETVHYTRNRICSLWDSLWNSQSLIFQR